MLKLVLVAVLVLSVLYILSSAPGISTLYSVTKEMNTFFVYSNDSTKSILSLPLQSDTRGPGWLYNQALRGPTKLLVVFLKFAKPE